MRVLLSLVIKRLTASLLMSTKHTIMLTCQPEMSTKWAELVA